MRLKRLEIYGFKSFPARTTLEFAPGVTAVVGPNGCGKSNVVDAIRWVLGEQSPRLLRGSQMADVLFQGSERLPASNVAEVSLTLEVDGSVGEEGLAGGAGRVAEVVRQFGEVKITRRLFRSGEAEYLINGRPCRMKDVTDMFLGSGVGARSYAIIEQGRVEQLITAKPEDRRLWIEEAAGTTLFRTRKLAAERKMERTRENLHRVTDILRELDRQLSYMRRLAKRAEQAREAEAEIQELELSLAARQRDRIGTQLQMAEQQAERLAEELTSVQGQLFAAEQALAAAREDEEAAIRVLNDVREKNASLQTQLEKLKQEAAFAETQRAELESRASRLRQEIEETRASLNGLRVARNRECRERMQLARTVLRVEHKVHGLQRERTQMRSILASLRERLARLQQAELESVRARTELENSVWALRRQTQDLEVREHRCLRDSRELAARLRATESQVVKFRSRAIALERMLHRLSEDRRRQVDTVQTLRSEVDASREEVQRCSDECMRLESKLETLEELRRRYEGFGPGVRQLMCGANGTGLARAVVADVIQVPPELERAVAAALGERLQCMIVGDPRESIAAVQLLRDEKLGRGSFIAVEGNGHGLDRAQFSGAVQPLVDLVEVDREYGTVVQRLLQKICLVSSLEEAIAYQQGHESALLLVTPEGETVDHCGVVTGGFEQGQGEQILARGRILEQLKTELTAIRTCLSRAQEEYARKATMLAVQENALRALDSEVDRLSLEAVVVRKDVDRLVSDRKRALDELEYSLGELATSRRRLIELRREREGSEQQWNAVREQAERVSRTRSAVEGQCRKAQTLEGDLEEKVRQLERLLATYRERHEAAVRTLVRFELEKSQLMGRMHELCSGLQDVIGATASVHDKLTRIMEREAALLNAASVAHQELLHWQSTIEQRVAAKNGADRVLRALQQELERLREAKNEVELRRVEFRVELDHVARSIAERFGVALEDVAESLVEKTDDELRQRLESLRALLQRVGTAGVSLVEELGTLEERARFLQEQKADLERSLNDLQSTIERLDRVSRSKFQETFDAVQAHFRRVIPRLFGGGEGWMVLAEPHDPARSGVEVVVRPPGKCLESVGLLSGGEKALAAVALIFALFANRPSPFCILDEVDAPLDDANVLRFTELVRDMSRSSQFIVITHNKRTMEAADRLYGVTMHEPGVSTLLAVQLT